MRQFKVPGKSTKADTPTGTLTRGERRKIFFMAVGLVLVVTAFILASTYKGSEYRQTSGDDLPGEPLAMQEHVAVPEIDAARIEALVKDAAGVDRVMLEGEVIDALVPDVRILTSRSFEAMEAQELDAASVERLLADPSAVRGQAFFARGQVEGLRTRRRGPTSAEEHIGRLILEDGSTAVHFLVLSVPEHCRQGRRLRAGRRALPEDLQRPRTSSTPGTWNEGPLLIGTTCRCAPIARARTR